MKSVASSTLALLFATFAFAGVASAQPTPTASADCPLDAFDFDNPTLVDTPPLPVLAVTVTNGPSAQTGVVASLTIPAGAIFERFLAPVPAVLEYSTVGLSGPFSPTPPIDPADIRAVRYAVGPLGAGQTATHRVVLREPGTPGVITDYFGEVVSQESPTPVPFSGHLRLRACPGRVYALNCLDTFGQTTLCTGVYEAVVGREFSFVGVGAAPSSPVTATTDVDGFALMPRLVDLAYLNGDPTDTVNDGYPLPGLTYTIAHTLPAPPTPNGPFWNLVSWDSLSLTVSESRMPHVRDFVDNATCGDVVCQTPIFRNQPDGVGYCEYDPLVVNGECTLDDLCLTNLRCEDGACVGDPIICGQPGTCEEEVGTCDPSTGLCVYSPIDCATSEFTFYGVLENADGTLSSFECLVNDGAGELLCRVVGGQFAATGELLLGGPQCVSNYPPIFYSATFGAEQGIVSTFTVQSFDPDGDPVTYAPTALPSGWTLSSSGVLTVPPSAPVGDYTVQLTVSDGVATVPGIVTVTVRARKFVFMTEITGDILNIGGTFTADFAVQGGSGSPLANADAICQQQADTLGGAQLAGRTFVAWLSTSSPLIHARDRITDGFYRMPEGSVAFNRVVARSKSDLLDGALERRVAVSADGELSLFTHGVWTGTSSAGLSTGQDCDNWTSTSSGVVATRGLGGTNNGIPPSSGATSSWTDGSTIACSLRATLYCFEL